MNKHVFLEEVCEKCPGTGWGKSAICRIHDMHIGKIQSCPEWKERQVAQEEAHQEKRARRELEPALETIQRAEKDLRNYQWMVKAIQEMQHSEAIYEEEQKLLQKLERMKRYEGKVKKLEAAVATLQDDRERAVAEGMMDGMKMYEIAQQLRVSRQTVDTIRRAMIRNLAWNMYEDEVRKGLSA